MWESELFIRAASERPHSTVLASTTMPGGIRNPLSISRIVEAFEAETKIPVTQTQTTPLGDNPYVDLQIQVL